MEKKKGFFGEFKEFISRGNVVDMAVGVVIGGAFKTIVDSLVADIITPFFGLLFGGIDFKELKIVLGTGENAPTINYGIFINAIISFLLLSFVIFCMVKIINRLRGPKEEAVKTTKECPYCHTDIPIKATRCPHCTSKLDDTKDV